MKLIGSRAEAFISGEPSPKGRQFRKSLIKLSDQHAECGRLCRNPADVGP